jgi:hypothetical protein
MPNFAFITFVHTESARIALEALENKNIQGETPLLFGSPIKIKAPAAPTDF